MRLTIIYSWLMTGTAVACASAALVWARPAGITQSPQFRAKADIVQLDVSVLDNKTRQPVTGLTAADFTLLEDGNPRPIVAFSSVEIPAPVPSTARWMREVAADVATNQFDGRRLVTVVIDDMTVGGNTATRKSAIEAAQKVIDGLGPTDAAAVVYSVDNRKRQDFTTDRAKLRAAIDRMGMGGIGRIDMNSGQAAPPAILSGNSSFGTLSTDTYSGECMCGVCSIRILRDVADALRAEAATRKIIVYISAGVNVDWNRTGLCGSRQLDELQRTFQAARLANITVYSIDAAGLRIEGGLGGPMEYMQVVAENTGGRAIINNNMPEREVPRIFAENTSYYLLGYELQGAPPQGDFFRRLEVKVNRPGVEVRSRKQYYGPPTPSTDTAAESVTDDKALERAAVGVLPARDVSLRAQATAFLEAQGASHRSVAVVVGVDQPLLDTPPDAQGLHTEHVTALIHAFGPDGRSRAFQKQEATISMRPAHGGRAVFEILTRMELEPGPYSLRVAVGSRERERVGSVSVDVVVPSLNAGLFVSGILLSATPAPVAAPPDALKALVPVIPTARRGFTRATRLTALARINYPGGAIPVAVLWQIKDAADRSLTQQRVELPPEVFKLKGSTDLTPAFSLDGLAPGEYVLSLDVTFNRRVTSRHVRFTVVP